MEIIQGKIKDIGEDGITIFAPYFDYQKACDRKYETVEIGLNDGRKITPEQRRKAYAIMNDISDWCGELPEYIKRLMKMEFVVNRLKSLEKNIFSLSDCDVTTAKEFITFLIDFCIEHEVPTKRPLYENAEDLARYVYSCLMKKICCVCGKSAELHHCDAVGMGRDRTEIMQIGMLVLPLCRQHHTEFHNIGNKSFFDKYHIEPIKLTKEIGKKYKLTKKNLGE